MGKAHRFKSKNDAMNRRIQVWICSNCQTWHKEKIQQCRCGAGNAAFDYFPSTAEAKRYASLMLLQSYGKIKGLQKQPNYPIEINGIKICNYRADFGYWEGDKFIIEDVKPKGFTTDLFKLKKKLVEAIYGIKITIVENG